MPSAHQLLACVKLKMVKDAYSLEYEINWMKEWMNLEFGFWSNFFPRKRPQTKLVASWQPEKDQLVPCRLRGLKNKRQKMNNIGKRRWKGIFGKADKRIRRIWNGMKKGEFGMEKVFGLHLICISEKKICFDFIFYLKTVDSWHIVLEKKLFLPFIPLCNKDRLFASLQYEKTLKQINLLYNRDKKDWATISLFKLDNSQILRLYKFLAQYLLFLRPRWVCYNRFLFVAMSSWKSTNT